ncbi:quinone-dependent dihydroorotate dehydrogenase [Thioflexithrix psekupsensis]|uniref:Dihydroorotate dehydrogenase (quinone) n=1 Tax=Thioflexithrix psekupsensis TaxID=1570016 RepID=A0A251XBY6_9GAMM|nr:quinone-dependent dihydroorotate dehydrogenase [Thioflexithrix psekupsensis]OUD16246.1 dihydroorotate dehydrogenase (quinone) [Thioflexithrix psekupsensis]
MLYSLLRPLLFSLEPEKAHTKTLATLALLERFGLAHFLFTAPENKPVQIMGLTFPNPVGLAAGLDKNGEYIDALACLGFGFLELGTVTPLAQSGNPLPRLFRILQAQALINRMGFNNHGIDYLLDNVKKRKYQGILGINLGKNAITPLEKATDDYLIGLHKVYAYADYITINISSPNTPGLRQLQQIEPLAQMLSGLKQAQHTLHQQQGRYVPLVVKIAPDLTPEDLKAIAEQLLIHRLDGVIATNTTLEREAVKNYLYGNETGGLSGAPLTSLSTAIVAQLHEQLAGQIPIIAAGGIMTPADAQAKLDAGASLVQIYTGLIYHGPELVKKTVAHLKLRNNDSISLPDLKA